MQSVIPYKSSMPIRLAIACSQQALEMYCMTSDTLFTKDNFLIIDIQTPDITKFVLKFLKRWQHLLAPAQQVPPS